MDDGSKIEENIINFINTNPSLSNKSFIKKSNKRNISFIKRLLFCCISLTSISILIYFIIFPLFKNYYIKIQNLHPINTRNKELTKEINITNIDYDDEFFQLEEVKNQIIIHNITNVRTIYGGRGKVGNALIMLNNLINICENIKCKNIIVPKGLQLIIKKPINYTRFNITIFPYEYKKMIQIDIQLRRHTIYWFNYRKKPHKMKLNVIREEVLNNLPKMNPKKNDLYIHIRSGDIFTTNIRRSYSQPPLCFYQKIINDNKFEKVWIISNGLENPVIFKLLNLYINVKFIQTTLELAISVLVNSYNMAIAASTFSITLISFNMNLKNLFVYNIIPPYSFDLTYLHCTIHKMIPSPKYNKIMESKWKNTKEQLDLMIHENCTNSSFIIFNNSI